MPNNDCINNYRKGIYNTQIEKNNSKNKSLFFSILVLTLYILLYANPLYSTVCLKIYILLLWIIY